MERDEFADILDTLRHGTNGRIKFEDEREIKIWFGCLKHFDVDELKRAVAVYLLTSTEWPTISAIATLAVIQQYGEVTHYADAFDAVMTFVRKHGSQFYDRDRYRVDVEPAVRQAVAAVGGLSVFGMTEITDLGTLRAQFREVYQHYAGVERMRVTLPTELQPHKRLIADVARRLTETVKQ